MCERTKLKPEEITVLKDVENSQNRYLIFQNKVTRDLYLEVTDKRQPPMRTSVRICNVLSLLGKAGLLHLTEENLGPALLDAWKQQEKSKQLTNERSSDNQ
jgi:hypothetical protein